MCCKARSQDMENHFLTHSGTGCCLLYYLNQACYTVSMRRAFCTLSKVSALNKEVGRLDRRVSTNDVSLRRTSTLNTCAGWRVCASTSRYD